MFGSLFFMWLTPRSQYTFFLLISALGLLLVFAISIAFTESPKYYFMMGKYSKARRIVRKLSVMYKRQVDMKGVRFKEEMEEENMVETSQSSLSSSQDNLLKNRDERGTFNRAHFFNALRNDP